MQPIGKGDMLYNTVTRDYGIAIQPPVYFDSSRQTNVSVQIPGRAHATFWHMPDVSPEISLKAVSVGDTVEYITAKGRKNAAPVLYINRTFAWCILDIHGQEMIAHSSIITRAMPAKKGA